MAAIAGVFGTAAAVGASVAPGTTVNGTSSKVTFVGTISGVTVTVHCTSFKDAVTVQSGDKKSVDIPPPTITGCTDSLTGTDTIATNSTNGSWELKVNSAGTQLSLVVPKAGATFKTTFLPSCTITVAPNGPASIVGTYSSTKGTDKAKNASFPVSGSGCSATSSEATTTVKFSPNPGKIPPFAS
ncbi:MAG: hypothetical protein WAM97_07080 [Acidimicrobiales bacterium]